MLGQTIGERFDIVRVAGSGGMGIVYRARDRHTGLDVALKVLREGSQSEAERFKREARVLAEVRHPCIVRYVAHGETVHGAPYLAMEWLDGMTLEERLAAQGLTTRESVRLAIRVAEALAVLHARGIVHRDIKPANVFLPGGSVDAAKLLDLGIVRVAAATRAFTSTGFAIGTPGYMAPEQARGEKSVDARADVFSLGCVLYECLTGRVAFLGEGPMAVLAKVLLEDAPRVSETRPDVAPELDGLVAAMLAKPREKRPASIEAVLTALRELPSRGEGRPSSIPPPMPRALTLEERRLFSIVMAMGDSVPVDLASAPTVVTDLAGSRDPDLFGVVAPFGAVLERLPGGVLVGTIAGRGSATDLAARAARCALAMAPLLPGGQVSVATGLGEVTRGGDAGPGGRTMGEAIDRAARLLLGPTLVSAAEAPLRSPSAPAVVRIDETTAGLLSADFEVTGDAGGLLLAGVREDVESMRTLLGKPAPFVGRDREMATLSAILDECASEPVARVVLVTAPAGGGKSRLRTEFVSSLREEHPQAEVWTARGDPMTEGAPFGLVGQLVRSAAGLLHGEPLATRQQKLRARVSRHIRGAALKALLPFLGELAGTPFSDDDDERLRAARADPALMGDLCRRAFDEWVGEETGKQIVAIVVEDLHWGDLPSVQLLDAVLRVHAERPLFVVGLARPEVHQAFPDLWRDRDVQELRLAPLTKKSAEKLARAFVESAGDEEIGRIVERAAGNAFFLEELIRAKAEGRTELPETVLAMVETRLERLDPEARRILRAGSVLGSAFSRPGVAHLLGREPSGSLDAHLAELVADEFLVLRPGRDGTDVYAFRHAIVRDAAYAMLTAEDRRLAHRLAGEWLEREGDAEPLALAEHYERGGAQERAARWYLESAQAALEASDLDAALQRADKCIACGAQGELLGRAHGVRCEALVWRGDNAQGIEAGRRALDLLPEEGDDYYRVGGELGLALYRATDGGGLVELGQRLLRAHGRHGRTSPAKLVCAARFYARVAQMGIPDAARGVLEWTEQQAGPESARSPVVAAWIHVAHAARARHEGDLATRIERLRAAAASLLRAGDDRNAALLLEEAAVALANVGDLDAADEAIGRASAIADRLGLRGLGASCKISRALIEARRLDYVRAVALAREAADAFRALGDRAQEGVAHGYLALFLRAVELNAAEREAELALTMLPETSAIRGPALQALAIILLMRGKPAESLDVAAQARAVAERHGNVSDMDAIHRIHCVEALWALGQKDKARAALREARDRLLALAAKLEDTPWRRSFLEKVSENARTLVRAGEWLV
jgi:tetratricopeptide (TPR) repeat protein